MNYSLGEIPATDVLRLLLKHGIRRFPVAGIRELFNVVSPHLSFFERTAVTALISTFYNEDLEKLLKSIEKRPMRPLPKSLMYDSKYTNILRKHIADDEKFAKFQFDVYNFDVEPRTATAATAAPATRSSAATNTVLMTAIAANDTPLPPNVLGTSRRTGPRRTTRSHLPRGAANSDSNENSNNDSAAVSYTGPRRNFPALSPVALPGIVRAPYANSLAPRVKGSIGYKNTPAPPTIVMPKPAPTGEKSWFTGKYRRHATRRRNRRT